MRGNIMDNVRLTRRRVEELLTRVLVEGLGLEGASLQPDTMIASLGLDSLDLVDVVQGIERACGVRIRAADAVRLRTLDDVVKHVLVTSRAGGSPGFLPRANTCPLPGAGGVWS